MFFVFDLDGVLFRETAVIKGAPETLKYLRKLGHKIAYLSNNATLSRKDNMKKLQKMGFECSLSEVMATAYATAVYLSGIKRQNNSVFVIGEKGLRRELRAAGLKVYFAQNKVPEKIGYVVVGLDRKFNYIKLKIAARLIEKGAIFIATNTDCTFPGKDGIHPGGGSIVTAVAAASGVKPFIIGKPKTLMLDMLMNMEKTSPKDTIVIGDKHGTDIMLGKKAGTKTVMVLTGVTSEKEAKAYKGANKPDYILRSVTGLKKLYCKNER